MNALCPFSCISDVLGRCCISQPDLPQPLYLLLTCRLGLSRSQKQNAMSGCIMWRDHALKREIVRKAPLSKEGRLRIAIPGL